MNTDELREEFRNPGSQWRGKPFWAWNGELEETELLRQIRIFKQMGMGGFFMHSRTGLQTEYLGQKWFELIESCADKSQQEGLEAWIYDEDRWPSGTCGGEVSSDENLRARFLRLSIEEIDNRSPQEKPLALFVAGVDGLDLYGYRQIPSDSTRDEVLSAASLLDHDPKVPVRLLVFSVELEKPSSFYNGYTWIDALNRDATERFIETTHERYLEHLPGAFGKSVHGVFTDEPNRGTIFDSFNLKNEDPEYLCPYTDSLFPEFASRFSYDLLERLPELFLRNEGRIVSEVKLHYVELLQQLFIENYAAPIHAWCKAHDLILTGHILHEDSLAAQTAVSGSVIRYYEHMDRPGIDILGEANRNYHVVKQLASAARQLDKHWMLSELYGGTGWQMNFRSHKWVGDWQTLLGINLRCHHLSWYTMEGEAKRDYPASIAGQSAWFDQYELVESYFARFGLMMSQGEPECSVLVLDPVESMWATIYPGCSKVLSSQDPTGQRIEREYAQLLQWLLGVRIDFDYGNEDFLHRYGRVESQEDTPVLCIGKMRYTTVIVSSLLTIRATTLELLEEFASKGGRLLFIGEAPSHVDGIEDERAQGLCAHSLSVPFEQQQVTRTLLELEEPFFQCFQSDRLASDQIFSQVRRDEGLHIVGLVNLSRDQGYESVTLSFESGEGIEQYDLVDGSVTPVAFRRSEAGRLEVEVDLPPVASRLYVVLREPVEAEADEPESTEELLIEDAGPFSYSLDAPNVCVLDRAEVLLDGSSLGSDDVLKMDIEVRRRLAMAPRAGDMIQPWLERMQEGNDRTVAVTCRYQVEFKGGRVDHICVEQLSSCQGIRVNGKVVPLEDDSMWIDIAFRRLKLDPDLFSVGLNTIEVTWDYDRTHGLEAVYLLGSFSLDASRLPAVISDRQETLRVGTITNQGLPFYSDRIDYRVEIPDEVKMHRGYVRVRVPSYEGALCNVLDHRGNIVASLPWEPYEAIVPEQCIRDSSYLVIQIVLTRRNTFGPLHQLPLYAPGYGPDSYLSEGPNWSDVPVLYPAGLLTPLYWVLS